MTVLSRGEETGLGPTLLAQGRILGVGGVLAAETPAIPSAHWAPPRGRGRGRGAWEPRVPSSRSAPAADLTQRRADELRPAEPCPLSLFTFHILERRWQSALGRIPGRLPRALG